MNSIDKDRRLPYISREPPDGESQKCSSDPLAGVHEKGARAMPAAVVLGVVVLAGGSATGCARSSCGITAQFPADGWHPRNRRRAPDSGWARWPRKQGRRGLPAPPSRPRDIAVRGHGGASRGGVRSDVPDRRPPRLRAGGHAGVMEGFGPLRVRSRRPPPGAIRVGRTRERPSSGEASARGAAHPATHRARRWPAPKRPWPGA